MIDLNWRGGGQITLGERPHHLERVEQYKTSVTTGNKMVDIDHKREELEQKRLEKEDFDLG